MIPTYSKPKRKHESSTEGRINSKPVKKVKVIKEKLTYEYLKIAPPEQFDYSNYEFDWCRYCGARYSSNFTKGPWGSRTLCTVHYIDWN